MIKFTSSRNFSWFNQSGSSRWPSSSIWNASKKNNTFINILVLLVYGA